MKLISIFCLFELCFSTSTKHTLEKVTVQFHAVVSCDFKLDETDLVVIRFDDKQWPDGGGWECKKHALARERFVP